MAASELDLPIPHAELDDSGRPLTVLQLLEEMKEERQRQQSLIDEAEERERIVMGQQWSPAEFQSEDQFPTDSNGVAVISENLLYPNALTWAARVDQGRIDPRANPFHPESGDIEDAEGMNQILDYEKQKCSESELIAEAAIMAQCHGDVLFYPQWSEADGPHRVQRQAVDGVGVVVDPMGQPVFEEAWEFGGVVEDVVAAPDYWTSGEQDYKDAEALVVRRIISKSLARRRLREAVHPETGEPLYPDANPKAQDYPTALDTNRRGVECFEIWLKPGTRAEHGAFCLVVEDKAVMAIPYPEHPETKKKIYDGQLPGDVWKIGFIRGCPRGKTHVADAIHQQRLVNRTLRAILQRVEVAKQACMVGPSEALNQIPNAKTKRVPHDTDKDLRATMMWFAGPEIPSSLFKVYHDARAALFATFGVSEATVTGGDPTETKSGQQLRDATALDAQKIKPARTALEQARLKVAKDKATLWQVHADEARFVRVLGPGGEVRAKWLRGADVGGADIALEIGSGIQSTRIAGMRDAEQSAEAGYLSPQDAGEMRRTGLPMTVGDADARARIDAQAKAAAKGKPQMPLPDVDPQVAVERLQVVAGSMAVAGEDAAAVVALAKAYAQMAALQAKAKAANQGGANGPGRTSKPGGAPQKGAVGTTKSRAQPEGIQ